MSRLFKITCISVICFIMLSGCSSREEKVELIETNQLEQSKTDDKTEEMFHQVRAMFPLYNGEKLSLSAEYRYQFAHDQEYENKVGWDEQTGHVGILYAGYKVTENLSVDGYYRYDLYEYDRKDDQEKDKADNYYGEFYLGWTYTF